MASQHQQEATTAEQADPSLAAKKSWSKFAQRFSEQVPSPSLASACLKTETPDYAERREVTHSPVLPDQSNNHESAVPIWSKFPHRFSAQVPSPSLASARLKTETPDYAESREVTHSPVHPDQSNNHEPAEPISSDAAKPSSPANRLRDCTPMTTITHQHQPQSPTRSPGSSDTMPSPQSSSSDDRTQIAPAVRSPLPNSPDDTDKLRKHPNDTLATTSANQSHPCSRTSSDTEPTETVLPNDNVLCFPPTDAKSEPKRRRRRTRSKAARSISFSNVQDTHHPNETKQSLARSPQSRNN